MENKITFVDKLRDRGFVDQWGFMAFAIAGFVAIASAKWFELDAIWIAVGAVVAMFAYAGVIGRAGTGRVRADQAGDNCYYLGLIYTLASLSYAIATFDPNDTATTIVQGFGVALATTIFGLILRVFFSQGRPDLENVEEQSRLELTEAATQLKTELTGAVRKMKSFATELQQVTQEVHESSTTSMQEFSKTSIEGMREVVETANEAIRSEANDFAARSKRYTTTFDSLLTKLESHGGNLDKIASAHEILISSAASVNDTTQTAQSAIEALEVATGHAVSSAKATAEAAGSADRMMQQLVASSSNLEDSFKAIKTETESQLSQLASGNARTVESAVSSLQEAANRLSAHIAEIGKLHDDARSAMSNQAQVALETTERHNEKLEAELVKSTELTARVHTALVEMTENVAKAVEGAA